MFVACLGGFACIGFVTPSARPSLPATRLLLSGSSPPPLQPSPPPPPPASPISFQLCLYDGNVLFAYSLLSSLGGLFTPEELFASPNMDKDLLDISLAFSAATSLVVAWLLAASVCGACREDWLYLEGEEHAEAPLGVSRLLKSWALSVPLTLLLRLLRGWALEPTSSIEPELPAVLPALSDAALAESVGQTLAVLVVMTLWRRWFLQRKGIL